LLPWARQGTPKLTFLGGATTLCSGDPNVNACVPPLVTQPGAGRFDPEHSPIIRPITGDEEIVIDVSKPEG